MSPVALLYILLASPIFSENLYRHSYHANELPTSHFNNVEHLFRTSPFEESSIFGEDSTFSPEWFMPKTHDRRSIVRELFPESALFGEESSIYEPIHNVVLRNIKLIRKLAEVNPEMVNVVVDKLFRPESRLFAEKLFRDVEPESVLLSHKLIKKNLPVYLREKIARRIVKNLLASTSSRRSILSEVSPIESIFSTESSFEEPIMTKIIEKLIRRNVLSSEEPKVHHVAKALRRLVKNVLPFEHSEELYTRRHFTASPIKAIRHMLKSTESRKIRKAIKNAIRREVLSTSSFKPEGKFCYECVHDCSSPMSFNSNECRMCEEICGSHWESPLTSTTSSVFGAKNIYGKEKLTEKLIEKLIKKLSTEELLF